MQHAVTYIATVRVLVVYICSRFPLLHLHWACSVRFHCTHVFYGIWCHYRSLMLVSILTLPNNLVVVFSLLVTTICHQNAEFLLFTTNIMCCTVTCFSYIMRCVIINVRLHSFILLPTVAATAAISHLMLFLILFVFSFVLALVIISVRIHSLGSLRLCAILSCLQSIRWFPLDFKRSSSQRIK